MTERLHFSLHMPSRRACPTATWCADMHQYTRLSLGWVVRLLPSPWVGLRQGCLFTRLHTGFGACLLPAHSVPLPRPDLVDFSKLTKSNANYNLQRAFRTAEQHLGLARLLDPEGEPCTAPARVSSWGTPKSSAAPKLNRNTSPKPKIISNLTPSQSPPRPHEESYPLLGSISATFSVYLFFFGHAVPQSGIEPVSLAVKACSPNHWTAREFLFISVSNPTLSPFLSST